MNIADLFKPKAAPVPQAESKAAEPGAAEPSNSGKPAENAGANNPAKESENPFDKYQQMFDNAAKNSGIQAPTFNLDPKVLSEVSSKMDFTKGINPELVQKATNGDAAAMIELMKNVGQNSYHAAMEHATKLTDVHLGQRSEFENQRLQRGVKEQLTSDAISSQANIKHPLVKAEINRIASQFAASPEYADASPQEIAKAAQSYFLDLHAAMNPADPSKGKDGKPKEAEGVDYMKYLGAS